MVGFRIGHWDGASGCLLYCPSKGSNSMVEVSSGLDGRIEVEGGIKGMPVQGPVGVFVIVECPRCGEVRVEVDFEYYGVVVGRECRDRLGFGGSTTL